MSIVVTVQWWHVVAEVSVVVGSSQYSESKNRVGVFESKAAAAKSYQSWLTL